MPRKTVPKDIYQLRISLTRIEPEIWRVFQVHNGDSLVDLHQVIQIVMGWEFEHLYGFTIRGKSYSPGDEEGPPENFDEDEDFLVHEYFGVKRPADRKVAGAESKDAEEMEGWEDVEDWGIDQDESWLERAKLHEVIGPRLAKFSYMYDYGDSWAHTIVVETRLPIEEGVVYPRCIAGERACPPEDCGGSWGYYRILEALKDPTHPDNEERLEWLGEYDPLAFSVEAVNQRLHRTATVGVQDAEAEGDEEDDFDESE